MKSILVADAEAPIRRALRTVLECQDCRVIATSSTDDTLTVLSYFKPNLILAERELGLAILKRLKERKQEVPAPILLMTDKDESPSPGVTHIKKPFELQHLVSKVSEVLGAPCSSEA